MPETESPRTRKPHKKLTVNKTVETQLCYIHDKVGKWEAHDIRTHVCSNDEPPTEFGGKFYCVFHLPDEGKNLNDKFDKKFQERLKAIEGRILAVEELPENKKEDALNEISYDFRHVWFPSEILFNRYEFKVEVNFRSAIFNLEVFFTEAEFNGKAFFNEATFKSAVDFFSANFKADASFRSVNFIGSADFDRVVFEFRIYFNQAIFTGEVLFTQATFKTDAFFNESSFMARAYFNNSDFLYDGMSNFKETNFARDVYFENTNFYNDVSFDSATFGIDSYVLFLGTLFEKHADFRYCTAEGYLRFSYLRQGVECSFHFSEAAFEKANRISFHTVKLFPSWFVNIDSRKFVFTDIDWLNLAYERGNKNIERELATLEKRGIKEQRKRLLEIAARQLAVNAEENNRYEEAAKFRYLAMETKRLEEGKFFSKLLITLYKWTSGYGESWSWAALVLVGILFLFGLLYASPFAKFDHGEQKREIVTNAVEQQIYDLAIERVRFHEMNLPDGVVHSLYVAALQRPEPKPADTLTRFFIILETIFAPLQAALLALAIRRKFMR